MRAYIVGRIRLRRLKCNFVTVCNRCVTAVFSDTVRICVGWLQSYTKNVFSQKRFSPYISIIPCNFVTIYSYL